MDKRAIAEFLDGLTAEIRQYRRLLLPRELGADKRLLLLRSAGLNVFEQCLREIAMQSGVQELLVIGHAGDARTIARIWNRPYELIALEGNYSVDQLLPHMPQIVRFQADANVYLAYSEDEQGYLNIYELMSRLGGQVYEYQVNTYWTEIKNMKKYHQAVLLATALVDWYYGEQYE